MVVFRRFWAFVDWVGRAQVLSAAGAGGVTMLLAITWGHLALAFLGTLLAFAIALFAFVQWRSYQDRNQPAADNEQVTPGRISLVDFMKEAELQGWKFQGEQNLEVLDLLDGLRQAGSDGALHLWGRFNRYGNRTLIETEVLAPIASDHWRDYSLDVLSVLASDGNGGTVTYNLHNTSNRYAGGYADIHLDKDAACSWLTSAALDFKGRRERQKQ